MIFNLLLLLFQWTRYFTRPCHHDFNYTKKPDWNPGLKLLTFEWFKFAAMQKKVWRRIQRIGFLCAFHVLFYAWRSVEIVVELGIFVMFLIFSWKKIRSKIIQITLIELWSFISFELTLSSTGSETKKKSHV